MLKNKLKLLLDSSSEESFADLWHQACLKRQTAARAHEGNSEFLGQERFQQLHTYIRAFNSEFLGRFPDEVLGRLLEIATFHSFHEQDIVGLLHKKNDHASGKDGVGNASRASSSEPEPLNTPEKGEQRDVDVSSEDDEPHVDAKTHKSGFLHFLDWRMYPDSQASRFRKYFCVLSKGSLSWFEGKDSVRVIGTEDVASAEHCMLLTPGTVGYKKIAPLVRESEMEHLPRSLELHFVVHGSTQPRRAVFMAKSFDASLAWVKALQSWMDIPAEEVAVAPVQRSPEPAHGRRALAPAHHLRPRQRDVHPLKHPLAAETAQPQQKISPEKERERGRRNEDAGEGGVEGSGEADEEGNADGRSPMASARGKWGSVKDQVSKRKWKRRQGVTLGLSAHADDPGGEGGTLRERRGALSSVGGVAGALMGDGPGGSRVGALQREGSQAVLARQASLRTQGSMRSIGGASTMALLLGGRGGGGLEGQGAAMKAREGTEALGRSGSGTHALEHAGGDAERRAREGPELMQLPRRRVSTVMGEMGDTPPAGSNDEPPAPPQARGRGRRPSVVLGGSSMKNVTDSVTGSMALGLTGMLGGGERQVRGINVAAWHKARNASTAEAWGLLKEVFGDAICVLAAGDSFGEGTMLVDRRRTSSAVALTEVRLLEVSKAALMGAALYDVVLHGMVWASPIVSTFLRPHPLLRQESQISLILNIVSESPFFQQLPLAARRGLLEGGHLNVTAHGEQVLGSYVPPFTLRSPPPLFIILHGRVEVHQGASILKETMAGLPSCPMSELQGFLPRKGQVLQAEEAWGGPLVWTDLRSLQVHRMQEQIPLEKDANKAHRLRQQLWTLQEAFTYSLVATEHTAYLRIDPHDWIPVLAGVRDVVFRATTLYQILKKPPRERAPQQARLIASLLQGFTAFQQLPLSLVLNLSYTMEFVEAGAGKMLLQAGEPVLGVFLVLQGKCGVYGDAREGGAGREVEMESQDEDAELLGEQLEELVQGAWFGEAAVRCGRVAGESVVTTEDARLLMIPAAAFRKEIRSIGLGGEEVADEQVNAILETAPARRSKEDREALGQALASVAWLGELDGAVRRRIADAVKLQTASRGEILAKQGSATEAMTFLLSGSISVHHLGVSIEEPGHLAEGFDPTPAMSEETSWVYAPLTAKWGKCIAVIGAGGSAGELGFALGSERGSTILAREPTEFLCLRKEDVGNELMYLLKVHLQTQRGIPTSIKKVPGTRTEFDMVRLVAFLKEHKFFQGCTEKILAQVAQLIELHRYDKDQVIQTDRDGDKLLHIVEGGRVRLQKVSDAGKALLAKLRMRARDSKLAKHHASRRTLLQELKATKQKNSLSPNAQPTITGHAEKLLAKQPSMGLKGPDTMADVGSDAAEPVRGKSREVRQLGAMAKSRSKKVLLKVFSGAGARRESNASFASDEELVPASGQATPELQDPLDLGGGARRRASVEGAASAVGRRSSQVSPLAGVRRVSAFSRTSSAGSSGGGAGRDGVLLDWGKHFVLGAAWAETEARILRMSYGRWVHLQKLSTTLEKLDAASFMGGLRCFAGWSKKELANLAERVKVQHYARGATVVRKGEEPISVLVLKRGRCALLQHALPSYNGPAGAEMVEDDKLYRVKKRQPADGGQDYGSRIVAGKLFRCPACQDHAMPRGRGKPSGKAGGSDAKDGGSVCAVCHGTRAIRPGAMSRAPAGRVGTESVVGRTVGTVVPKGLINSSLERMNSPLEHEVVASEECEVYSIDLEHLMDVCDAKPKLLLPLTEESQRLAKWLAAKHRNDIGTRSAIHDNVEELKNPIVRGQLDGEQPNTDLWNRLYPHEPITEIVVPRNMGSLSKSGKSGALLIGTWKNKTKMPNHRVDSKTKLLMHASQGPISDSQLEGQSVDTSALSFEHDQETSQQDAGSDLEDGDEADDDLGASGESDGLEDFFVTSGAGLAAENNRMAWDDDQGATHLSGTGDADEGARRKAASEIPTFEQSQAAITAVKQPRRSRSSLEVFCGQEATKLLNLHLEVMVGGAAPQQAERWKRNSRKRHGGVDRRAVSCSPNAVDHIKTLQRLHWQQQQDFQRPELLVNSPPRAPGATTVMPPVHAASEKRDAAALSLGLHDHGPGPKTMKARRERQWGTLSPQARGQSVRARGGAEEDELPWPGGEPDADSLEGWGVITGEDDQTPMAEGESRRRTTTRGSRFSRSLSRGTDVGATVLPVQSFKLELAAL